MTHAQARQAMRDGTPVQAHYLVWGEPDRPVLTTGRLTRDTLTTKGTVVYRLDGTPGDGWFRATELSTV